jgi:hypothetical protein
MMGVTAARRGGVVREDEGAASTADVLVGGRDDARHPVRSAVLALVAVGVAAWALVGLEEQDPAASRGSTGGPPPAAPVESRGPRPSTSLSEAGGTAGAFYSFAAGGDAEGVASLWADWVTVSTPRRMWTMTGQEASDRGAWRSPPGGRHARSRDLLRPLARSGGSFSVYLEDMVCVGTDELRVQNPVGRVTSRVLVAVRPTVGTPCARWWAIDLVFTPEERISQVHVR